MFFSKKKKKSEIKCEMCSSSINDKYSFCPFCGNSLIDKEQELKDFGMLGKIDSTEEIQDPYASNFGITDKLIGSLVNNLVKNLDKQFKDTERAEVKNFPNGIKIRIGPQTQQTKAPKQMKILDKPISLPCLVRVVKTSSPSSSSPTKSPLSGFIISG